MVRFCKITLNISENNCIFVIKTVFVRYFIELAYNGKAYNGWQIQPNAPSVQQTFQEALSTILRQRVEVVGAGRTDTGVHASYYVAHFDLPEPVPGALERFCYHLNALLPHDIAVSALRQVRADAHARFDAQEREYKYYISSTKNPFCRDTTSQLTWPLDMERMNVAAARLLVHDDFTSFSKLHSNNKTNVCDVRSAWWEQRDDLLVFTISADRFLRNMVRAVVGTLLEVGRGKMTSDEFEGVILGRDRALAGGSAPPQGLFLTRVNYPEDIYL